MRWDVGWRGKNGKEDVISPDGKGLGIQVHRVEFNLALTHFKCLLSQWAGFVTFCCTVTHTEITEPQAASLETCARGQILSAPVAVTCLGITAKWVSICWPLRWLIVLKWLSHGSWGTVSPAWEMPLCQQWAHSVSGSGALRVLNLSHYLFWALMNSLHQFVPCSVSLLYFLQCPTWRTPLKWGMRRNEATYKINQVWHKNWWGMQSRWHIIHLLWVEFFVYRLQNLWRTPARSNTRGHFSEWELERKETITKEDETNTEVLYHSWRLIFLVLI